MLTVPAEEARNDLLFPLGIIELLDIKREEQRPSNVQAVVNLSMNKDYRSDDCNLLTNKKSIKYY